MAKNIHRVSVVVDRISEITPTVRVFHLRDKDSWELPPFSPGAHIDVHLSSGKIRQYSLCGDPALVNEYTIAVEREKTGRGGSREMHDSINIGQELMLSLPRNTFPVVATVPTVLVAGGIGITPYLSALSGLKSSGINFHLHYCAKTAQAAAFTHWLDDAGIEPHVTLHLSETGNRLDIDKLISNLDTLTHLYCCGPTRMIDACTAHTRQLGDRLHVEHFGVDTGVDPAYTVKLARSGQVISVASGQTMLQALRMADVDMPASCEAGICLDCKCRWLEGNPVHRELTMPKADRSQWITPCVSGCDGLGITLDL